MRHGLLHALIGALALACCAPAQAATVTIAAEGRDDATIDIADLQASWDVQQRPYTVGGTAVTVTGISIDRLLDAAGVDPFRFTGATVAAGNRTIVLAREQLTDPAAFPDGRPVFYPDAAGVSFLRPPADAGDPGELVTAAALTVSLAKTSRLAVSASASRTRAAAGDRIAFSATVRGAAAGEDVRVRWTFDDDTSARGTAVTHRFRRPGTYKVVVGATTAADPAGASAVVTIRIGDPPAGPDREGGGTNPDAAAPDSGAAAGTDQAARGGSRRERRGGSSRQSAAERERSRESWRQSAAERERSRESSRQSAAERERSRRGAAERERARESSRRPTAARERRRAPSDGPRVEGTLIGDPEPAATATAAGQAPAARTGNPESSRDGLVIPPAAVGALAAASLLALGAWFETRGIGRPRPGSTP